MIGAIANNATSHRGASVIVCESFSVQESVPEMPDDITRVYVRSGETALTPLAFESVSTSVPVSVMTRNNRASEVKIKGEHATNIITDFNPRFYLFVFETMNPPPHFLVRLKSGRGARRLTAFAETGRIGFIPEAADTIKLQYRVLNRVALHTRSGVILYVLYMEAHSASALAPGEYAFIGNNFMEVATFRLAGESR